MLLSITNGKEVSIASGGKTEPFQAPTEAESGKSSEQAVEQRRSNIKTNFMLARMVKHWLQSTKTGLAKDK